MMLLMTENAATEIVSSSRVTLSSHSFASDFGLASFQPTRERSLMRSEFTDQMRSPAGTASLGFLLTLVDYVTSDPALSVSAPDWTATQNLSLHAADAVRQGPVLIDSNLVRIGKKAVVVSADVYDGRGLRDLAEFARSIDEAAAMGEEGPVLAGRALVTFVRLPRTAATGADDYRPEEWIGRLRERNIEPVEGDIYSRLRMRVVDPSAGVMELDLTPFVANMIGTIQGGAQALLVEAAAHAIRPGFVSTDMQLHYLSQVRVGPARSYADVVREASDHCVVNIRLVDAGDDDRLLALTTVTMARRVGLDNRVDR
jgi:acyl-coenzyme A thioesterase PaaI-like protein